jgi:lysophospholipid acyltransferase (LPLAT)-like uncharacterized protein
MRHRGHGRGGGPYTLGQRVLLSIVPRLASTLILALGATLRYEDVFAPGAERGDLIPGPTVFAFWHRSLLVCAHRFRNRGIAILISRSFDGELIARTVERLGFLAIRGSSSRGGPTALRQMAEAYAVGHRCAFTADGPKGPAMQAKPGPAQLAALVGAPWVGAFDALPNRAWTLNTWDRFLIPKPFATVRIGWPAHVPPAAVQTALDAAVALAGGTTR